MQTIISMETCNNGFRGDEDRRRELNAFDETKSGIKGLVDSGAKSLPRLFIRPPEELLEDQNTPCVSLQVPVIDLGGVVKEEDRREGIVRQILDASEDWGFFQVVNHGIPPEVLDKMVRGVRMFHEQDAEAKKPFYGRDRLKKVNYLSNYDLYRSRAANWRDTLGVNALYSSLDAKELPDVCRDVMVDYINHALKLSEFLLESFSVALGLSPSRLGEMGCTKGWNLVNHYYPACPSPELTLGTSKHTDPTFFTLLLQDDVGGLQVLHRNRWVDVRPARGALVVNVGDLLQVLSNDKLKSVLHRVTANRVGPRISVALHFRGLLSSPKLYGPIKELLSEENPAVYREFTLTEFARHFDSRPLNEPGLDPFKLQCDGNSIH